MPPAAVTLYCVLLFTFSHLHRFWLFCPCVLQFLSSLFFISPSLTTAFLFILLLPPHPSSSFYLPSLSSTLQERLRWFQSTRRTLHVQRLEGIPLRSLSISLPVPSWSVCLPAVRITTSSITLAPALVCSPVIKTMFDMSVMKPVSQVVPVWRVHRACFVKLEPVEMSSSYTSDQNYPPRIFFPVWQKSLTHCTFFIKPQFINVTNFCLEIKSFLK